VKSRLFPSCPSLWFVAPFLPAPRGGGLSSLCCR
jgi:hypothetical protein